MLFSARYAGTAHVIATIDSSGRLVRESVRIEASHDLFANAAKAAVTSFAYEPAIRSGQPVSDRLDIRFEFRIPSSQIVPTFPVWRVERDTAGYRITTGLDSLTREIPPPVLSDSDMTAARQSILEAVRRTAHSPPGGPLVTEFKNIEAWTSNVVGAKVETTDYPPPPNAIMGGGGRNLWCQAVRSNRASGWAARCDVLSRWVS